MLPLITGVLPRDHCALACVAGRPHRRRVHLGDVPFNRIRCRGRSQRPGFQGLGRLGQLDRRISVDVGYVGPPCQRCERGRIPACPDHVGHPIRPVGDAARLQRRDEGTLGACGHRGKRLIHISAFLQLGRQGRGAAEIGLFGQEEDELGLDAARSGRFQHPRIDLALPGRRRRRRGDAGTTGSQEAPTGEQHHRDQSLQQVSSHDDTRTGGTRD